jgi:chemotaxis protein MotB
MANGTSASKSKSRVTGAGDSGASGDGRWTLAFAIVMLLLFALFLVLYATSKKEALRLRGEVVELKAELAKPRPSAVTADPAALDAPKSAALEANAALQAKILAESKAFLAEAKSDPKKKEKPDVEVLDLANGDFLVRVAAPDLFGAGKSRVSNAMRPFVDRLGELIVKSGRRLRVEGHADFDDSEAIQRKSSDFANTWELSAARSAGLAQYWMKKFDLEPTKLEVAGFGKYRPLEKVAGRLPQANRRIEIVILRME